MLDKQPTPLALRLAARIARDGPLTIADYMDACLGDPQHGYYMTRDPFGTAGDFVTAPEVSQMFGELIGLWAVNAWQQMGAPSPFILAELGPGRGTLMADALRAARLVPAFETAARIVLVETSPRLTLLQRERLAGHEVVWLRAVDAIPAGPAIILANEFFDALPVHQFVRAGGGWSERCVALEGGALAFQLRPAPDFEGPADVADGETVEIAAISGAIMSELAARIARDGGAILAIDYGHEGAGHGDTLQALRAHAFDPPLAHPGEADLTVHVDFARLAEAARAAGAVPARLMTQGAFLLALGLVERAGRLGAGKPAPVQDEIRSAVERLAAPGAMGDLFKVLCVTAPDLHLPPF
ncbi:NADH dehydrogenase [ubiquinone] 1 alpha subcomplex assembly factor 7 [Kaistia hirudinis]|uniref:NADH dehydrogenase [ubiquinone] 1 alpha subcomplex assembly factor 7 n=1 Tax=Kaistia hirudinis TaxID=1293440 RepID=A0A840AWG2_9HYPH|nr:class I SAM-dependent methyltransferase [Kaistia hirudinis]MBB3933131.1 NADH dehydrogenase [ubiquinone] 1 alpha subcomplex assembly factor 7 [Kaistia hirudinis]